MSINRIGLSWKLAVLLCVGAGIALLMLFGTGRNLSDSPMATAPQDGNDNGGSLLLQAPSFVNIASAEELDASGLSSITTEAGFAAYYHYEFGIDLANVRDLFSIIESENDEYIIGSFTLDDFTFHVDYSGSGVVDDGSVYSDEYDIHVYVSADGWIMAYYLADVPTAKSFDTYGFYLTRNARTLPELAVSHTATTLGIGSYDGANYYHFTYPSATNVMFIGEKLEDAENQFTVNLPESFTYLEFSASLLGVASPSEEDNDNAYAINNNQLTAWDYEYEYYFDYWVEEFIETGMTPQYWAHWRGEYYAFIDPARLPVGEDNTISVNDAGSFVIVYAEG